MSEVVSYEVVDAVAHVTIERPEVKNAMNAEVFEQLGEQAARAGADPAVGAVLVSGRGGTFSSGLDTSLFGSQGGAGDDGGSVGSLAALQASFTAYEELDKPTVAAVEGYCFGAGIQLALACHLRAVAPDAQMAVMEARWALVPDLGGTWRLPRLVGLGRATELTLSARRVPAEEARAMGLAELTLDGDDVPAAAHDLAARLAAGPGSVRRAPRLLRENLSRDREAALRAEAETQGICLRSDDFAEAVAAATEGRAPRFTGA